MKNAACGKQPPWNLRGAPWSSVETSVEPPWNLRGAPWSSVELFGNPSPAFIHVSLFFSEK